MRLGTTPLHPLAPSHTSYTHLRRYARISITSSYRYSRARQDAPRESATACGDARADPAGQPAALRRLHGRGLRSRVCAAARSNTSSGSARAQLLCILGARLAALNSSVLPKKKYRARPGRCSATGHPPLPRLIELVASKVADFTAFDHSGALPALAQQFCVVAPQTASGWPAARVHAFMRFLLAAESPLPCRIDPSRCYATGHSMGGSGALVS